ncbi:hypothetical protein J2S30_003589 [Herbaspirillum rubrisubalbicans]|uniref:hypothetical protein n=1 Tax=Herbaspirillum rubrisubalbicans TaxID=80842 RepID=UPI0020A1DD4F|nr:hypothetical protein [Herbaspirillum rubrisubalbicans]MCP1575210.1 hypothetical protein [Herbaspirillum rubrisubalbicans]
MLDFSHWFSFAKAGLVSYDEDDNSLEKSTERRLNDAIDLATYLLETGDFEMGRTCSSSERQISYVKFVGDRQSYFELIREDIRVNGLDHFETGIRYWISKINGRRMISPPPPALKALFER